MAKGKTEYPRVRDLHTDIQPRYSVAYLRMIAELAGFNFEDYTGESADYFGVDCRINSVGPVEFPRHTKFAGQPLKMIDINIQVKSTIEQLPEADGYVSYSLDNLPTYNFLRQGDSTHKLLVLLQLPRSYDDWLEYAPEPTDQRRLLLRGRMLWVNLVGAAETNNTSGVTVYFPVSQVVTPENLQQIFKTIIDEKQLPDYVRPK